jgi:hypothetical protein
MKVKPIREFETYKLALYPLLLAFVVLISWFTTNFDLEAIKTETFWINVFLKYLLVATWTFFGIPDGKKRGEKNDDYKEIDKQHKRASALVNDKGLIDSFKQFNDREYLKDNKEHTSDILRQCAVSVETYEILTLRTIKKRMKEFDLSEYQVKVLIDLKKGKYDLPKQDYKNYLTSYIVNVENNGTIDPKEQAFVFAELLPKMVLIFATMVLTTALSLDEKGNIAQASFDTVSNIAMCATSYGTAWLIGKSFIMTRLVPTIDNKLKYIHRFIEQYENGKYVEDLKIYETITE